MIQAPKKASVLIYTLFLISIALIFSIIVFNIVGLVMNDNEYQNITRKLSSNVLYKGDLAIKYLKKLNSNGGGFTDNASCPITTMSGTLFRTLNIATTLRTTPSFYCQGTHNGNPFYLSMNDTATAFTGAEYQGYQILLSGGVGLTPFADSDNTLVSYITTGLANIDRIDDSFDSDDYKGTSTGNLIGATYYYPDGYLDDDATARKISYFYIPPGGGYWSVFWSNTEMKNFINANTNNNDVLSQKLGSVGTGKLYLDIDKNFSIKIAQFDKTIYDTSKQLVLTGSAMITATAQTSTIGYIQPDGTLGAIGTAKVFNFINNDYAIFLLNSSTGSLLFRLSGYNQNGSGVYLVPVNDSGNTLIKYLGSDIIIDSEGRFINSQFEIVGQK